MVREFFDPKERIPSDYTEREAQSICCFSSSKLGGRFTLFSLLDDEILSVSELLTSSQIKNRLYASDLRFALNFPLSPLFTIRVVYQPPPVGCPVVDQYLG